MAKVFIGLPVYNGADCIDSAIHSLLNQSYQDWSLLISDNCSIDSTSEICQGFVERDNRITYFKQKTNLGAAKNFEYVLNQAHAEFFMWASADDIWEPMFIESMLEAIGRRSGTVGAFSLLKSTNLQNVPVKNYESLRYSSSSNTFSRLSRFVLDREILGKANFLYSVFKTAIIQESWHAAGLTDEWGADMILMAHVISKGSIEIVDEVLFNKRIDIALDDPRFEEVKNAHKGLVYIDEKDYSDYCQRLKFVLKDVEFDFDPILDSRMREIKFHNQVIMDFKSRIDSLNDEVAELKRRLQNNSIEFKAKFTTKLVRGLKKIGKALTKGKNA